MQVTDLHISKFRGFPGRSDSLGSVCRFLKSHVRPSAAVVTGDIVDAKDYKLFGSEQVSLFFGGNPVSSVTF